MGKSKKVSLIRQKIKILENPFLDLEVLGFKRNLILNKFNICRVAEPPILPVQI